MVTAGGGLQFNESVLLLWEPATGRLLRTFRRRDDGRVLSVAFSADGRTLASGREEGRVKLWNVTDMLDEPLQQVAGQLLVREAKIARTDTHLRIELAVQGRDSAAALASLRQMKHPFALVLAESSNLTDAALAHLKGLAYLRQLDLRRAEPLSDAGLEHLRGLTGLTELDLSETKVTDAGLVHLKTLTALQTLKLRNTGITDAALDHLKGLSRLRLVDVAETKVPQEAVKKLRTARPELTVER